MLLVTDLTLEGWTTSLPTQVGIQDIIALYADHGTHEQFHSESKTDLDRAEARNAPRMSYFEFDAQRMMMTP